MFYYYYFYISLESGCTSISNVIGSLQAVVVVGSGAEMMVGEGEEEGAP